MIANAKFLLDHFFDTSLGPLFCWKACRQRSLLQLLCLPCLLRPTLLAFHLLYEHPNFVGLVLEVFCHMLTQA
jgi:hypothetical protein